MSLIGNILWLVLGGLLTAFQDRSGRGFSFRENDCLKSEYGRASD